MNQQQLQIDLKQAVNMVCECGNDTFEPAYFIKRVSPLVSPTGEELIIPVQIFRCTKCGVVHPRFIEDLEKKFQ